MVRISIIVSAFLFIMLALLSCGDDSVVDSPPVEPETFYLFSDYIHFDTVNYFFRAKTKDTAYPVSEEPFVNCEKLIGEPFTDVNGNGVYDSGIDIFIRSLDSNNMDLNFNGVHDGPNDPWSPGVPFDDINGNGIFENVIGFEDAPFYDFNNNYKWDSLLKYYYRINHCNKRIIGDTTVYELIGLSPQFVYVSDSGYTYEVDLHGGTIQPQLDFYLINNFELRSNYVSPLLYGDPVNIVETDTIRNDSIRISYTNVSRTLLRETILDSDLQYSDSTYSNLLLIRLTFTQSYSDDPYLIEEFYFSKELGFVCWYEKYFDNYDLGRFTFFLERIDSIPLVLTKP